MASELRPALFLDRDGVLNVDHGYVHRPDQFEWVPGAVETIRLANELGYLVVVVTNQAGIARGFYTEETFREFMTWLVAEAASHGARIDAYYYSPYHPVHGLGDYLKDSDCRKPKPGMLLKAFAEHPIDRSRSLMVGDFETDVQAAEAAGIPGHRFLGGNLLEFVRPLLQP